MGKIKIGVFGAHRGKSMMRFAMKYPDTELVAVCDKDDFQLHTTKKEMGEEGIFYCHDFEDFIKCDMDAVVLANYATEHAPYAIRCLNMGLHVFTEVLPFQTLKEGVELIEAVEKSGKVYAYGENYSYMPAPYEMRRLYREGLIGDFEYGEGNYVHNCEPIWHEITYGEKDHWRNNVYSTFYCTHSIGPIVHITGLRPVKVTGFESGMSNLRLSGGCKYANFGLEMVEFENGGLYKSIHGGLYKNNISYIVYGSKGRMETARETARSGGIGKLYLEYDAFCGDYENPNYKAYDPTRDDDSVANDFGHGNSDYYIMRNFIRKIQGYEDADVIDVYEACDMFLPGMFAHRSLLQGGLTLEIPNLRDPEVREKWRNDTACTDPKVAGDSLLPQSSKPYPEIPDEVYEKQKQKWEEFKAKNS